MSRILLAWELGANLGHLYQLVAVAERLRAEGHVLLVAARDLKIAAELLAPRGFDFVQAPVFHRRQRASQPPASHAEMLALEGYADDATACGIVNGWVGLLRAFRPQAIAGDYAPGALFAGRALGVPRAHIGTGFEIPPLVSPLPSIRPWETISPGRLQSAELQLLERVNRVMRSLRGPELDCLADWFRSDVRILATFPELDPFGPRPGERYVGPIYESDAGDAAEWPPGEGPRIFAYLRGSVPGAENVMKALAVAPARSLCVAPGMQAMAEALASKRLSITSRPVRLSPALGEADLVLGYGGHGVTCAALAQGLPLVIAPQNVEQFLHARRVEAIGAGVVIGRDRSVETVSARITQALRDENLGAAARQFAACHAGSNPSRAAAEAAALIGTAACRSPEVVAAPVSRDTGSVR